MSERKHVFGIDTIDQFGENLGRKSINRTMIDDSLPRIVPKHREIADIDECLIARIPVLD